ncbi:MAG: J domain-containing protein [Sphingomonadales bacterium]|nr:MAG: J domain-containing protein [Sphingomonadales bacterium]
MNSSSDPPPKRKPERFHGRARSAQPGTCEWPGCTQAGEFRAPKSATPERDGYRWYCLEHVRDFNAGYNYFEGLEPGAAQAARRGHPGWERGTRPFAHNASAMHIDDPMEIFAGQRGFGAQYAEHPGAAGKPLSPEDRASLRILGLTADATLKDIKLRYKDLVRKLHPDAHGGDRRHEAALRRVIDAYTHLAKSPAFL